MPSKLSNHLPIYNNISKYGHSNFVLVILEIHGSSYFCKTDPGFYARETFFIQLFKSLGDCLNILDQGGSSVGYIHTQETKDKMQETYSDERRAFAANINKGGITNPTHLQNMSDSATEFWNSGSDRSAELKTREPYGFWSLYRKNLRFDGTLFKSYPSFIAAGKDLGACRKYLAKICDTGKIYRKVYLVKLI
uniref:GIY endonuclease n=1 Tax=Blastocladiella sp. TaxID=2169676 RepID=A0A890JEC7_9FUNG|nr:GIY endonuclease [Blastocladiella sp.]